jgi:hypothetical protein
MVQDVNYLLELIEDDEFGSSLKEQAKTKLEQIKTLQDEAAQVRSDIESQRYERKHRRVKRTK